MVLTRVQYSNFAVHKHFLSISDSYIEFSCLEGGGGGMGVFITTLANQRMLIGEG